MNGRGPGGYPGPRLISLCVLAGALGVIIGLSLAADGFMIILMWRLQ